MPKSVEEHARDYNQSDPDFDDQELVYQVYDVMREQDGPFSQSTHNPSVLPETAFYTNTYEESFDILRAWRDFSSADIPRPYNSEGHSIVHMDPPGHSDVRRALTPYFSPTIVDKLQHLAGDALNDLIDEIIETGHGDLADLAWRFPGLVLFKEVLGMPVEMVGQCLDYLYDILGANGDMMKLITALMAMRDLVTDLIQNRIGQPARGDVIDALFTAEIAGEPISEGDIVENAFLLIAAGLETTSNALTTSFHHLAIHSDDRDRLAADSSLIVTAVEEFVRHSGSVHGLHRRVTTETEIGGKAFCPGDVVVVNFAAANRDPAEFPDPNKCIIDRKSNRHLGFGAGVHRCLGSNLARLEMRLGLEIVLERMPDFRLDPDAVPQFHGNAMTRGFTRLPVTFTPGLRRKAKGAE